MRAVPLPLSAALLGFSLRVTLGLAALTLGAGCARDEATAQAAPPPPSGLSETQSHVAPSDRAASDRPLEGPTGPATDDWVERVLRASDPRFADWLAQAKELRLQILVSIVEPGSAAFTEHAYRADAEYFYPASAIKTFLAVAALRAMHERAGGDIPAATRILRCRPNRASCEPPREDAEDEDDDEDAPKRLESDTRAAGKKRDKRPASDDDAPKKHKKLRVGEEIWKLLALSDNDSYARLWDIVGQRELNEAMATIGFSSVRFHHRMDTPSEPSRSTLRVLLAPPGKRSLEIPARESTLTLAPTPAPELAMGRAYRTATGQVDEPMSFADKNYVSLRELQRLNVALLFPDRADGITLGLSRGERDLVIKDMTAAVGGGAGGHHPLAPGVLEVLPAKRVRYVGKSGRAYGFHLENAYIEDTKTHRGYFVTVTVYANPDGVLNDDHYAYDELSTPLLRALGTALTRAILPP